MLTKEQEKQITEEVKEKYSFTNSTKRPFRITLDTSHEEQRPRERATINDHDYMMNVLNKSLGINNGN